MFSACFQKELRLLHRSWRTIGTVLIFALLLAVTASVTLRVPGLSTLTQRSIFCGAYLLIFLFSGTIFLSASWDQERRERAFLGSVLAGGDAWPPLAAKVIVQTGVLFFVGLFAGFSLSLLFPFPITRNLPTLVALLGIAALGYVALGSVLSALSSAARDRDIVFPILFFPLLLPFIWALGTLGVAALDGARLNVTDPHFVFVVAFDVISIALASIVFPYVIEE